MRCTAHFYPESKGPKNPCVRELGHSGLHRYIYVDEGKRFIQEFPNSYAIFIPVKSA